jgi:hypothetical protein
MCIAAETKSVQSVRYAKVTPQNPTARHALEQAADAAFGARGARQPSQHSGRHTDRSRARLGGSKKSGRVCFSSTHQSRTTPAITTNLKL